MALSRLLVFILGDLFPKLLEEVESLAAKVERDEVKVESLEVKEETFRGNVEQTG